jgi:predicted transcriptional regulator
LNCYSARAFEVRTRSEANIFIAMNEKEAAILAFPMENNLFDYRGFSSTDPLFLKWCRDIFEHYWATAVPVS